MVIGQIQYDAEEYTERERYVSADASRTRICDAAKHACGEGAHVERGKMRRRGQVLPIPAAVRGTNERVYSGWERHNLVER